LIELPENERKKNTPTKIDLIITKGKPKALVFQRKKIKSQISNLWRIEYSGKEFQWTNPVELSSDSWPAPNLLRGAGNSLHLTIDFFSPTCFGLDFKSPFSKGGFRGIFQVSNPPFPLFLKGGCKQLYALLNKLFTYRMG